MKKRGNSEKLMSENLTQDFRNDSAGETKFCIPYRSGPFIDVIPGVQLIGRRKNITYHHTQ